MQFCSDELSHEWLKEEGPIEAISAIGYFVCASLLLLWAGRGIVRYWYMPVAVIALGFRELDFHVRFSHMNVTKIKFFTSATVPLSEKLIVTAIYLFLAWTAWSFLKNHARGTWGKIRAGSFVSTGVVLGLLIAIVSKVIDGVPRALRDYHLTAPAWLMRLTHDAEEILELGIPLMFCTAVLCLIFHEAQKTRRAGPDIV